MKHHLDADAPATLYKARVRPIIGYAPLTWMSIAL